MGAPSKCLGPPNQPGSTMIEFKGEAGPSQAPLLQTKFWLSFGAYPHGRHRVIDIDFNNQNMLTRYLGLNHVLSHEAWALRTDLGSENSQHVIISSCARLFHIEIMAKSGQILEGGKMMVEISHICMTICTTTYIILLSETLWTKVVCDYMSFEKQIE